MGTGIQALSINASWYGVNRVAEKMIQLEKEKLAARRSLRWPSSFRT
jgi:hypothetical protein